MWELVTGLDPGPGTRGPLLGHSVCLLWPAGVEEGCSGVAKWGLWARARRGARGRVPSGCGPSRHPHSAPTVPSGPMPSTRPVTTAPATWRCSGDTSSCPTHSQ